jgi:hypothetical protein
LTVFRKRGLSLLTFRSPTSCPAQVWLEQAGSPPAGADCKRRLRASGGQSSSTARTCSLGPAGGEDRTIYDYYYPAMTHGTT